jgi:hypothetical protein
LLNANDKTKQINGDKEKCFHYYIPNQTNINEINPSLISYHSSVTSKKSKLLPGKTPLHAKNQSVMKSAQDILIPEQMEPAQNPHAKKPPKKEKQQKKETSDK